MKAKIIILSAMMMFGAGAQANFVPSPMDKPSYENFDKWRAEFERKALSQGVDRKLLREALSGERPDSYVISLDRKQAKPSKNKKKSMQNYLKKVITDTRIKNAKILLKENRPLLNKVHRKYGVEPEFVVALWGLESNFGRNMGDFSVINSLMTLAYEGRRRDFFEEELINALYIIEQGHITNEDMRGSWAGAMGQSQFMPSSFFKYAVDFDGDGVKDIWSNEADVFGSIANYLNTEGWDNTTEQREKTLMHWNRSSYFVASVLTLADKIKE